MEDAMELTKVFYTKIFLFGVPSFIKTAYDIF